MSISEKEWMDVWGAVDRLTEDFPDIILIGGIAVYLHAQKSQIKAEFSHDVDACISLADFGDLRDVHVVTANKRLNKHQLIINGIDVDIYVERGHRLAIPFHEMSAYAESITIDDGRSVKVSCLEHLLILKLDATEDRWGTEKGRKDCRDVAKIMIIMGGNIRPDIICGYLGESRMNVLKSVERSSAFVEISGGNHHAAKDLRSDFDSAMKALKAAWQPKP